MAVIKAQTAQGFSSLPALRQLGLMIGLAASVALGVAVVMWSQEPSYSLLYGNLTGNDSSQVLDALQKAGIPYKVEESNGAVMVPAAQVHNARLKLASSGLPKGNGVGFELFDKEQELGTSKFIEQARYQHAIEIELARSIMTMRSVRNARVHLAIPKRTVFVRKKDQPTASVILDLFSGHSLGDEQVASIVHMVAASVPGLAPDQVTVVDQSGNLLSRVNNDSNMALTSSQFEFTRKLEDTYKQRIEELLSPIVGPGRVRAQVVADIDFTVTEKTQESYKPDTPSLRSEQVIMESSGRSAGASGVPGSLSNQPPASGNVSEADATPTNGQVSTNQRTTRNYELDKTISHTRSNLGNIRKISVAVLVDDLKKVDENGTVTRTPLNEDAIKRLSGLVQEAVGFDANRGDSVNVINASFYVPEAPAPLPEPPLWEQAWIMDLAKQVAGGIGVLILMFGVFRPVLRSLTEKGEKMHQLHIAERAAEEMGEDQLQIGGTGGQQRLPGVNQMENQLVSAKTLASQDPARVAQVVKTWVATDG